MNKENNVFKFSLNILVFFLLYDKFFWDLFKPFLVSFTERVKYLTNIQKVIYL